MGLQIRKTLNHGTTNRIVARLSLQTIDLIQAFPLQREKRDEIWGAVYDGVQQHLLDCFDIWTDISHQEAEIAKRTADFGFKKQSGGHVVSVDTIDRLVKQTHGFLYSAKTAIRGVKSLLAAFFAPSQKKKREIEERDMAKLRQWAEGRFGLNCPLTAIIRNCLWADEVIAKRNAVEHPGGFSGTLVVENFSAIQDPTTKEWRSVSPTWSRNSEVPRSITLDMEQTIERILELSEEVLLRCLRESDSAGVPVLFEEIPIETRDPTCPKRFRLTLDRAKVRFDGKNPSQS